MLYQELINLTGKYIPTIEEFEKVEQIYMSCDWMSKEDAAKVWKALFLEAAKKRQAKFNLPLEEHEVYASFMTKKEQMGDLWYNAWMWYTHIRSHYVKFTQDANCWIAQELNDNCEVIGTYYVSYNGCSKRM